MIQRNVRVARLARRYLAVQCVSDTGHRDAPSALAPFVGTLTVEPVRTILERLKRQAAHNK